MCPYKDAKLQIAGQTWDWVASGIIQRTVTGLWNNGIVAPFSLSSPHYVDIHSKADGRAVLEVENRDMFGFVPDGEER